MNKNDLKNIIFVISRAILFTSIGTAIGIIVGWLVLGTWNTWELIRW